MNERNNTPVKLLTTFTRDGTIISLKVEVLIGEKSLCKKNFIDICLVKDMLGFLITSQ